MQGDAYWFFGTLLTMKATGAETDGRVMVTENLAPQGAGSPLHVHHRENEWFYVLDGALRLWVDGTVIEAPAGAFAFGPKDVPHTFEVASPEARFDADSSRTLPNSLPCFQPGQSRLLASRAPMA